MGQANKKWRMEAKTKRGKKVNIDNKKLTFKDLTNIEPRLQYLYLKAKHYKTEAKYCPITTWYRDFKPVLLHLVGFEAQADGELIHSCEAWDKAYFTIHDALPSCSKGCKGCS